MMRVYLDHNATTPVSEGVLEAMLPWFRESFGNPSAVCEGAREAREAVEGARERVASLLGCGAQELSFTSGATEANGLALGSAWRLQPEARVLVVSAIEHSSVLETARWLVEGREGAELVLIGCLETGEVDCGELERVLGERVAEVALVCVQWANHETGVLQPVGEVGRICREFGVRWLCDVVQAVGKVTVNLEEAGVDFASVSGHKFGGPQGVGALFVRGGLRFEGAWKGGGQELGRRSGTLNVAGIVGLGTAADLARVWMEGEGPGALGELRDDLERGLRGLVKNFEIQGRGARRLPQTSSVRLGDYEAQGLLLALDTVGLCCSVGSACHSQSERASEVLLAMGLSEREAKSVLRLSLGRETNQAEVTLALELFARALQRVRPRAAEGDFPVIRGNG